MIIPGTQKELISSVVFADTHLPKHDGTVFAFIWLEDDTDGYAGLFWTGSAWAAGPNTFPEATHVKGSAWAYTLSGDATLGYDNSTVHWYMADATTEADITTLCEAKEHRVTSLTPAAIADAVWDEPQTGHTTAGTFGLIEDNIRGPDGDDLKDVTDKIELIPGLSEMAFVVWDISENITARLFVADPSTGNGLTGQLPYINLTIQRASDSKYWNGTTWQVASYDLDMLELDETAEPGVYTYILSGSTGNTQKDSYVAYATINNPGIIEGQNYEVHVSRPEAIARIYESEPS